MRFVPLVGEEGWEPEAPSDAATGTGAGFTGAGCPKAIAAHASPSRTSTSADLDPLARSHRRCARRADRRGVARHVRVLRMRERITRELIDNRASPSSRSKATGRTPRASTTTCATRVSRRPSGRHSPAFPPGCGATAEVRDFVDWLREHNANSTRHARGVSWPGSVQPVHLDPRRCSTISTRSIRKRRRSRACATAASRRGRPTQPPMARLR